MFPVTYGIKNDPILMDKSVLVPKYIRESIKVHIARVKSVKTPKSKVQTSPNMTVTFFNLRIEITTEGLK